MNPEDMKCCGNCKFREAELTDDTSEEYCTKGQSIIGSWGYCKKWSFDTLTRKDREKSKCNETK